MLVGRSRGRPDRRTRPGPLPADKDPNIARVELDEPTPATASAVVTPDITKFRGRNEGLYTMLKLARRCLTDGRRRSRGLALQACVRETPSSGDDDAQAGDRRNAVAQDELLSISEGRGSTGSSGRAGSQPCSS